jgi:hypothetical protein
VTFFLGTHQVDWLAHAGVPLFVSRSRLVGRRSFPRAVAPWALDSGGFTELSLHGRWRTAARAYVDDVRRFRDEIGSLAWCAPQDWMCEPGVIARTGLSVDEHQRRTLENYLELRSLAPELPFVPVLQGWSIADYWRHQEAYARAGVDLAALPLVGVGTVCRRQGTATASAIFTVLAADGLRLHGFGLKTLGLRSFAGSLVSADSLAWSLDARKSRPLDGHTHSSCANCLPYAMEWRDALLDRLPDTRWKAGVA